MPNEDQIFFCDHADLPNPHRALIRKACAPSIVAYLKELDKGLSGCRVWLARWPIGSSESKFHVLKIGPKHKIEREYDAIVNVASQLVRGLGQARKFDIGDDNCELLSTEYQGDMINGPRNLRRFIASPDTSVQDVISILKKLYCERMSKWHPQGEHYDAPPPILGDASKSQDPKPLREALDWWTELTDLMRDAGRLGLAGVNSYIKDKCSLSVEDLVKKLREIGDERKIIKTGPVHGDLHSQNVLVGQDGNVQLIDFGWTHPQKWRAVDFLMMECSLKFLVAPANAFLDDLLRIENQREGDVSSIYRASFENCLLGSHLEKIAVGIHEIRRYALLSGAVEDLDVYRRGLILLMGGLASHPDLNSVHLMASLAWNLKEL